MSKLLAVVIATIRRLRTGPPFAGVRSLPLAVERTFRAPLSMTVARAELLAGPLVLGPAVEGDVVEPDLGRVVGGQPPHVVTVAEGGTATITIKDSKGSVVQTMTRTLTAGEWDEGWPGGPPGEVRGRAVRQRDRLVGGGPVVLERPHLLPRTGDDAGEIGVRRHDHDVDVRAEPARPRIGALSSASGRTWPSTAGSKMPRCSARSMPAP